MTTSGPILLTAFHAESLNSDIAAHGSDQNVAPPDTQLAAGPSDLVSPVNNTLWVWSKTGIARGSLDLNTFFAVPSGYSFTDPRVAYDATTGRWLLSGLATDGSSDSIVYIAASQTGDPMGLYSVYPVNAKASVVQDQPKLGFDSAVVVLSWNDYSSGQTFTGAETWVLQKADLLTGAALRTSSFGPDLTRNSIVPVQPLVAANTAYLAYNNSCGRNTIGACRTLTSALGLVSITGTPAAGDVAWSEADPAIRATTTPPSADQPGAAASVETDDDRFLTAISNGGKIYVSGNDGCVPTGDSVARPCVRLIEVAVGGSPSVTADSVLGYRGGDVYYPAVVPDASGNAFMAATFSSSGIFPEATGVSLAVGASSFSAITFQSGSGANTDGRWGDYSGAAVDPSNPSEIWLAAEYAPTNGLNWGTAIGEMTLTGQASLGDGPLGGDPQSVATGPGSADVFWKGTDGNLWYTHSVSGGWAPAASLGGGPLGSNPHPVFSGGSTVDVFWKGADGNLWHVYNNGGAWASPSSLGGGTLGSDPQVTSSGNHDVAVFWRGGDKNLWEAAYQPGPGWRAPIFLGSGPLNGVPHAAAYNTNSYDVFWRGGNNAVWHNFTSGSAWSGAQSLGMGPIAGDPIAISAATNTVDIYWQGGDGGLWHGWYNAGWHGAQGYGGSVSSPPSPIAPTTGTVDVFWRSGADVNHLIFGFPTPLGETTVTGNPSAFSWGSGHEEVFWKGADGALWHDSEH